MADLVVVAVSPLAGRSTALTAPLNPGVALAERPIDRAFNLLARPAGANDLIERCHGVGVTLPPPSRRVGGQGFAIAWIGPGQWLVQAEAEAATRLGRLFGSLAALCSIVVVDDARTVISIAGPSARDTLAKMLGIDLHPRMFRPGHVAITVAGGISVIVWPVDEAGFELAVPRSLARNAWDWLCESAAEYGCAVGSP